MEEALKFLPDQPRALMEYQQLLKNMDYAPEMRLCVYEKYNCLMQKCDDCYLDNLTLKCLTGAYSKAIKIAKERRFHIYEGGEGEIQKHEFSIHVFGQIKSYVI